MARPKADIDANRVYDLASIGTKVTEIAEILGVSTDTIHGRFSAELVKGREWLKSDLRRSQIAAAKQGNSTMLVWLGKQYLNQSDSTIDDYLKEAIDKAGLTKEDLLNLIQNKDKLQAKEKRSFTEFCKIAGYPDPFAKQIEMVNFGFENEETRLLLGARGTGKTDYVTIMGTAYQIYIDPERETNLIVTKSKERNAAMLREIHGACLKNGLEFDMANSTCLRARGLTGKDHSVSAVTIKTVTLRGRHPKRVIMDDPVTETDVQEATRLQVERSYNEIMKLCQNVLIIGQPAHKYDLYARLRGVIKTMEVPHGSMPEIDHDLEAMAAAGVSAESISASYHLKVISEGTSPFDKVKYIDTMPTGDTSIAFIDPSFTGGDWTALTILKAYMGGVAVVGFAFKKAWNHCLDDIVPYLEKYGVKRLGFETNSLGDQPIDLLRTLLESKGIGVVGRVSTTNKHARIMSAGTFAHLIHLSKESHKEYIDQVVKYEFKAKHDDCPDSLASCLVWAGLVRAKG